jgi:Xaa-Pro aminopeptidase
MNENTLSKNGPIPFDINKLDRLLDESGIDVLIVNSKHNVAYLLGGYRSGFFDYMDAIGLSRYLPLFIYQKGKPESIAYYGQHMEFWDKQSGQIWVPRVNFDSHGSVDAMERAIVHIKSLGINRAGIGVERSFLPADAESALTSAFGESRLIEAHYVLESMRAIKTPTELSYLREASERVEAAMVATFEQARPGMTKNDVAEILRLNETQRGLKYEYVIMTADSDLHRNPSDQVLQAKGKMTLDSGGNYRGYIGDICRVGCFGAPDQELVDLLAEVDVVQQAARKVIKAGAIGGEVVMASHEAVARSKHSSIMKYIVHGLGIVSHERPQLTRHNPHGYPAADENVPLEAGMIISIETMLEHPKRGYVKLEDTIAVTADGHEALGDAHRGWNAMGV